MKYLIEIIENSKAETALYVYNDSRVGISEMSEPINTTEDENNLITCVGNEKTIDEAHHFDYSDINSVEKVKALIGKNIEHIYKEMSRRSNKALCVNIVKVDMDNKVISKRIEIVNQFYVINHNGNLDWITDASI